MKYDQHLQLQNAKLRREEQGQAVREDHDGANLGRRWSSQRGTCVGASYIITG